MGLLVFHSPNRMPFGEAGEEARFLCGALQVGAVVVHAAVILDALMKGLKPPGLPVREPCGAIEHGELDADAFYGAGTHEGSDEAAHEISLAPDLAFFDTHPTSPNPT